LTSDVCAKLVDHGVRSFQISLDGWQQGHDATRKRADGKGTFERIWTHLLDIKRSALDVKVVLRVHLQPNTVDSVSELARHIASEFASDYRFHLFFKAVGNWGGPNSGTFETLDKEGGKKLADTLLQQWHRARGGGATRPSDAGGLPYVCYAARPNSLVIRADGTIGKCTVMLGDSRNKIGTLSPEGNVELIANRLTPWLRGFKAFNEDELRCPAVRLPKSEANLLPVIPS
jgi:uncharacterized protein